jgi:hypothetical protein
MYLGLVARRRGQPAPLLGGLGLVLGALLFTKLQFAACAAIPLLSTLLTERLRKPARTPLAVAAALVGLPGMAFLGVHLWVVWGTTVPLSPTTAGIPSPSQGVPNAAAFSAAVTQGLLPFTVYAGGSILRAVFDFYLGGQSFRTFWGTVGWLEAPLQFGLAPINALVRALEVTWTLAVMGLVSAHFASTGLRLARVALNHRKAVALRLCFSDPLLASYMIFTAFMFGMFVLTDGTFLPQGRNWLPFLLPTWMLALRYAPRMLRRHRPVLAVSFARVTAGALILFCVAGSAFALATLEHRFYGAFPTFSG